MNKTKNFVLYFIILLTSNLNAQIEPPLSIPLCPVNVVTFTPQIGIGTNVKMILGGPGYNDGSICWNCYNDSFKMGKSRAFNMSSLLTLQGYTPTFSARIAQDLDKNVFKLQTGVANCYDSITWQDGIALLPNGNVGIGTNQTFGARLAVHGKIYTSSDIEVNPDLTWPDYVFKSSYVLPSLTAFEKMIDSLGYIPQIGSSKEIKNKGLLLGEMQHKQMEVIEMLLRYQFELNHQIDSIFKENEFLRTETAQLKAILISNQGITTNSDTSTENAEIIELKNALADLTEKFYILEKKLK